LNNFNNNSNNVNNSNVNNNNNSVSNNKINYYQILNNTSNSNNNNNNSQSINSFYSTNNNINPFSNKSHLQETQNEEEFNNNFLSKTNLNSSNNNNNFFPKSQNKNNNIEMDPDFYFAQQRQILMNYMMMNYIQNYRYKMINIMKNKEIYLNSKNNPYKEPKINFESFTLDHKNTINFNTFSNREYIFKYVTNYNIQIENEEKFQVTKRIIGKNGFFMKVVLNLVIIQQKFD
jgi:hypothetical protein